MRPIYAVPDARLEEPNGNRGLWYTRFFDRYDDGGTLGEDAKRSWVSDNARRTGSRDALAAHANRQRALISTLGGRMQTFESDWHFATGLGLPHPVENGLNWHHTLGVPYLPGSGVKGLLRAWIEYWDESLGTLDSPERRARVAEWFGTIHDRDGSGTAGALVFFDALPVAPVELAADVMTPHMDKWYEQGNLIASLSEAERIPADWHDPVPVPFLVVRKAQLQFGIALRAGHVVRPDADGDAGAAAARLLDAAFAALTQALAWLGAGAKTAAGYGRFLPPATGARTETAGIVPGSEAWENAPIEWDAGSSKLSAQDPANPKRSAFVIGAEARAMHAALGSGQIKKLKSRQLRRNVIVDVQGNQLTLKGWAPDSQS